MNDIRKKAARIEIKRFKAERKKSKANAAVAEVIRGFDFVKQNRMFADWVTSSTTTNQDISDAQPTAVNRARDKAKNSGQIKKFLDLCEKNIVYTGFHLHSHISDPNGTPDEGARAAVEAAWSEWGKKGNPTMCGMFSFTQAHKKLVREKARDGEYLVREITGSARAVGNKWGYALQIIPIECLDFQYSKRLSNGNVVIMGVEKDTWNRPVAYHILKEVPDNPWKHRNRKPERERIQASEIIHSFKSDFENQARGIPWAYAMLTDLHQYENWMEAVIIAKRISACVSFYYETPDEWDDDKLKNFNPPAATEPGTSEVGQPGVKKETLQPSGPNGMAMQDEQRAFKRDMATALDIAYHTFSNDLENVNFSSIRAGVLDERDAWRMRQEDEKDDFLNRVFENWLRFALLNGAIKTKNGASIPASRYEKFNAYEFQGRTWQWVDPLKDAQYNEILRDNQWKTDQVIASEVSGKELSDNIAGQARANELRESAGLSTPSREQEIPTTTEDPQSGQK